MFIFLYLCYVLYTLYSFIKYYIVRDSSVNWPKTCDNGVVAFKGVIVL